MPNDLGDSEDFRTAEQTRYDALCDLLKRSMEQTERAETLILTLAESVQNGTHQTVIHKQEGMGAVGIVCAVVSVCCFLMMAGMGWLIATEFGKQNSELHDLHAWKDVHSNDIAMLKAKIGQQK